MRYEFYEVTLDTDARQLQRDGKPVHVSTKALDLLSFLIDQRPRAIAKEEIHDRLWPDTFVGETSLPVVIREIRKALGIRGRAAIRTVHRFGYAFDAEIRETGKRLSNAVTARHMLLHAGREFVLIAGQNIVGRDPAAHVFVPAASVSRQHASITIDGGSAVVEDLQSKNGTRVDGNRIDLPLQLLDRATVTFGTIEMVYRCFLPNTPTDTLIELDSQ